MLLKCLTIAATVRGVQIIPWLRMLQNLRLNLVLECSTVIWRRRAFVSLVVRGQVRNSINFHRFYYYQAKNEKPALCGLSYVRWARSVVVNIKLQQQC